MLNMSDKEEQDPKTEKHERAKWDLKNSTGLISRKAKSVQNLCSYSTPNNDFKLGNGESTEKGRGRIFNFKKVLFVLICEMLYWVTCVLMIYCALIVMRLNYSE